jgi:acetolactate synthase-1/2/3 large subunit
MQKKTGAQIVVDTLRAEGVKYVFGVPGGQTLSINDYIYECKDIDFIATRHEGGAACAADAWGRLTGNPGVCLSTTGPGATNLITGIGGALRDSSPVIVLTCNNRRKDVGRGDAQEADHIALFQSLVKWSGYANDVRTLPELLRQAFRIALSGRPGPVHLDLARDVLEDESMEFEALPPHVYRVADRRPGDEELVRRAFEQLKASKRPVFWIGNGVKISKAGKAIMELAEKMHIPMVTTFNAIGAVPNGHELVFGPRSRSGSRLTTSILEDSDCVLVLGSSLSGPTTSRWALKLKKLIQIDIEQINIGRQYPVEIGIVGDIGKVVEQLLNLYSKSSPSAQTEAWVNELKQRREAWKKEVFRPEYASDSPVRPIYLMQELSNLLSDNSILAVDAGNPGVWSHLLDLKPNQAYLKPVNFGNMGFSLPAGIACKLAEPDREVVVLIGDGSLGMSLGELETAVRTKSNIIIVLMNDNAYGNIKQEQLHFFGPRYNGVDFVDVNYAAIMDNFGGKGERIDRSEDFGPAFLRAKTSSVPYLLDIRIEGKDNVWKQPF